MKGHLFAATLNDEEFGAVKALMYAKGFTHNKEVIMQAAEALKGKVVDIEKEKAKLMERLLSLKVEIERMKEETAEYAEEMNEGFAKLKKETPGLSETDRQLRFLDTDGFPAAEVVNYLRYRNAGLEYKALRERIAGLTAPTPADGSNPPSQS